MWGDLDRNRRVGGSRPNQNDYVFVILVAHPKSYVVWKAENMKVCLLLVWRVCDQAFGRYRTLKGAEK